MNSYEKEEMKKYEISIFDPTLNTVRWIPSFTVIRSFGSFPFSK